MVFPGYRYSWQWNGRGEKAVVRRVRFTDCVAGMGLPGPMGLASTGSSPGQFVPVSVCGKRSDALAGMTAGKLVELMKLELA